MTTALVIVGILLLVALLAGMGVFNGPTRRRVLVDRVPRRARREVVVERRVVD